VAYGAPLGAGGRTLELDKKGLLSFAMGDGYWTGRVRGSLRIQPGINQRALWRRWSEAAAVPVPEVQVVRCFPPPGSE
jgi:hypothetical protein